MNKSKLLTAILASAALSLGTAHAGGDMEKCKVVDKDGKGLIKEHKGACSGEGNSCAGHNKAGDASAWILVPKGECDKINKGDFSGVSDDIKDSIEHHEDMHDKMHNEMKDKMHDKMHDEMKDKMHDEMKGKMKDKMSK